MKNSKDTQHYLIAILIISLFGPSACEATQEQTESFAFDSVDNCNAQLEIRIPYDKSSHKLAERLSADCNDSQITLPKPLCALVAYEYFELLGFKPPTPTNTPNDVTFYFRHVAPNAPIHGMLDHLRGDTTVFNFFVQQVSKAPEGGWIIQLQKDDTTGLRTQLVLANQNRVHCEDINGYMLRSLVWLYKNTEERC